MLPGGKSNSSEAQYRERARWLCGRERKESNQILYDFIVCKIALEIAAVYSILEEWDEQPRWCRHIHFQTAIRNSVQTNETNIWIIRNYKYNILWEELSKYCIISFSSNCISWDRYAERIDENRRMRMRKLTVTRGEEVHVKN